MKCGLRIARFAKRSERSVRYYQKRPACGKASVAMLPLERSSLTS
jgi:hypothetical protein